MKTYLLLLLGGFLIPAASAQSPENWTRLVPQTFPSPRARGPMAFDMVRHEIVLFGGNPGLTDTWVWDGSNWTRKSPQISPPAFGPAAFDQARGQLVMFTGVDTWLWDGENWTKASPPVSPSPRRGFDLAYDAAHRQVVLFGGCNLVKLPCVMDDTWVWEGVTWSSQTPQTRPPAREGHALAYDAARQQVVLFGGKSETGDTQTWTWDGASWAAHAPQNGPTLRTSFTMTFDSVRGVVVLFGGIIFPLTLVSDTWFWDGANWTLQSPQTSPDPRDDFSMAYDAAHSEVVLFGGTGSATFGDTWVLSSGAVAPAITAVVNGASFAGGGVVPGEIATLFGTNLTSSSGINLTSSLPLPITFLQEAVTVNNTPAALFAVDNVNGQQQINFQVPWNVASGPNAAITITNNGAASASMQVPVLAAQPGIFDYTIGPNTFGAILHANFQLADTAHPAKVKEIVLIYCTGLGAVSSPPDDGAAGNGQQTTVTPTVTIGGTKAIVSFSGLAPGFVGLYQINVEVPAELKAGNQTVVISVGEASSNSVLLPVQ